MSILMNVVNNKKVVSENCRPLLVITSLSHYDLIQLSVGTKNVVFYQRGALVYITYLVLVGKLIHYLQQEDVGLV